MKKLELDIDAAVYEEALQYFKTKEDLESFISSTLIEYHNAMKLNIKIHDAIKELKNIVEYVISDIWVKKDDIILNADVGNALLGDNAQLGLKVIDIRKNNLGHVFYTFTPFCKETEKEIIKIILEFKNDDIEQIIIKDIDFLKVKRAFTLVYDKFASDETLNVGSVKYQFYLSLSYMLKVDVNEI